MTSLERRLLTIVAAIVPTVFIAVAGFIWTLNNKVSKLEGVVESTKARTEDRYTKGDARDDHESADKSIEELQKKIYELSAEVNRLSGIHKTHKHPG